MNLDAFFEKIKLKSELMEDMGAAMDSTEPIFMLGGGNPARIPEVEQVFKDQFAAPAPCALRVPVLPGNIFLLYSLLHPLKGWSLR